MSDYIRKLFALDELARRPGTPGEGQAARLAADRIIAAHQALVFSNANTDVDEPLVNLHLRLDRACDRQCPRCDGIRHCRRWTAFPRRSLRLLCLVPRLAQA